MKFKEAVISVLKDNLTNLNKAEKKITNGDVSLSMYTRLNSDYSLDVGFMNGCNILWLGNLNPFDSVEDKMKEIEKDYIDRFLQKNHMFNEYEWEII